ncbi:beta-galactosidase [Steroidobacter agaridevorans]|uniref:Beta-galactosidase n=1 Tax=Steroidobacter agaridevorans TaxID=2695856 RepID=A0A829YG70_9GAMM|nr:glycoside hydrolase family 2 TIM barrel-domain containing protein [Steroidobacter agaridevorans]GFE82435.1 beta-galactosidase [Steroidobacter agaridevorans]
MSSNPRTLIAFDNDWCFLRSDHPQGERPELDDSAWQRVELPHDWSIEDLPGAPKTTAPWVPPVANWTVARLAAKPSTVPIRTASWPDPSPNGPPLRVGPFDPEASAGTWGTAWTVGGVGWYRKSICAPAISAQDRVEIRFDGAFGETEVWLNGTKLGSNVYGYGAFSFDITAHLRPGQTNVIAVRVVNERETSRWYSGSGLNRHVWLTVTGPVRIAPWGVAVTTPHIGAVAADVQIDVDIENHLAGETVIEVYARLRDAAGHAVGEGHSRLTLAADEKTGHGRIALRLAEPKLWGPDNPHLYSADVSLVVQGCVTDRSSVRFGVRSIAVSATRGLTINGETVKLKGACVHADHGILGAVAIDRAEVRKVQLLKQHGYNAIRVGHHMFPPAFLDACDELGMLVVDEVFDVWETPKFRNNDYSKHFKQHWRTDIERMVRQDRNHPSIIFWSIGNEIPERNAPRGVEIAAELREAVLELDGSRLITAGINGPPGSEGEPARRSLDVVGYNYMQKYLDADHDTYPNVVFMLTEQWAKDIHDGWRKAQACPWFIGEFIWAGMEYLGEVGAGSSMLLPVGTPPPTSPLPFTMFLWDYPAYLSGCGEIDILGRRKPQGLYRDVLWERSALELLVQRPTPPGTYEWLSDWGWHDELESWTWSEPAGTPMTVRAYTHGDEVQLLLNGRQIGRRFVTTGDKLTAPFEAPYEPGELIAIAFRGGKEIGRKKLVTVGPAAIIRLRAERSNIAATPNDLAYVFAEILDAQGRMVPDAAVPLTFSLEGPARLRATGSANPRGLKSFSDPNCTTFHGEVLAIVQATSRPGRAVLRVSSPGLSSDSIDIEIGREGI